MKKRKIKKRNSKVIKYLGKSLLFVLKTPYYAVRGINNLNKKTKQTIEKKRIIKKRASMVPKYKDFKVIERISGDYEKWLENIYSSESQIGIILGARGSGKTAFGIKFLENLHARYKKNCFAIGFNESEIPSWIDVVSDISSLKNNSFVLIDEGGILFNSRSSMSNANKMLSQLIMIARHKNLNILFISQNSSNLDVNILRQADFLVLKPSSLLQKEFERKIIKKIYSETEEYFDKFKEKEGITYIYSGKFRGFISNPLPSFWKENISKSFK
ncbi:hypothetical protein KAJ38_01795 [Candidatus Pacearchaeota archaeon]|nr:hypothetical protein [Candidatus Pacearchaeota archaeon]